MNRYLNRDLLNSFFLLENVVDEILIMGISIRTSSID